MRGHLWLNKVASVLGPLLCDSVSVVKLVMHFYCHMHSYCFSLFNQFNVDKQLYWGTYILDYKLVIMSIFTYNWESVMDLDNKMLNIDKKKKKKQ